MIPLEASRLLTNSKSQLYLACYLQLIPFGSKVQDEIIPVVRANLPLFLTPRL